MNDNGKVENGKDDDDRCRGELVERFENDVRNLSKMKRWNKRKWNWC